MDAVLNTVVGLGFTPESGSIHNIATILSKLLTPYTVTVYDNPANGNLTDLTLLLLNHWLTDLCATDSYLMGVAVGLIEVMLQCKTIWMALKNSPVIARLLSLSKTPAADGETKAKIVTIVTALSKD